MSSISDHRKKEHGGLTNPNITFNGCEELVNELNGQSEAEKREIVVEWLNSTFTDLSLPKKASDEELRAYLINNSVLHHVVNRILPGSTNERSNSGSSSVSHSEIVKRFLAAMDVLGLPKFEIFDLEKGSMVPVINCLLTLREQITAANGKDKFSESPRSAYSREFISALSKEERLKVLASKFRDTFHNSLLTGHRFHDVFQLKQGLYADIPAATISEMMKPTSLDSAPTLSLLSVVNGILDESVEKKNGEIPHRVACLLRKVVQEIERRISTQAQHLKTQNNLFKAREEKYQSRIRVLEALATVTGEEPQIIANQLQNVKEEKSKADNLEISSLKQELEEAKRAYELQRSKMETEVKDQYNLEISSLKQQLEIAKKTLELQGLQMEAQVRDQYSLEISSLQQELEISKKTYEMKCLQTEARAKNEYELEVSSLKKEAEIAQNNYQIKCSQIETHAKGHDDPEVSSQKQELEKAINSDDIKCSGMDSQANDHDHLQISSPDQELEVEKNEGDVKCSQVETQGKDRKDLEILSLMQELEEIKDKYGMKILEMGTQTEDQYDNDFSPLKELEIQKRDNEIRCLEMEKQAEGDQYGLQISSLKKELEEAKNEYGAKCLEIEAVAKDHYGAEISSLKQDLEEANEKYRMKCMEIETQAKDQNNLEISALKQELEAVKRKNEMQCLEIETRAKDQYDLEISSLKQEMDAAKRKYELKCLEIEKQAKDQYNLEISSLQQELETAKKNYEMQCLQMKTQAIGVEEELQKKVKTLECSLEDSRNKVIDHEANISKLERNLEDSTNKVRDHEEKVSELERYLEDSKNEVKDREEKLVKLERNLEDSKNKVREHEDNVRKLERNLQDARNRAKEIEADAAAKLNASKTKEHIYQGFVDSQFGALKELKSFGGSIKQEVLRSQSIYSEELNRIGPKLQALARAAEDYHVVLAENRKLFNEVQDLKGNIRVFCRVRPFLPGQAGRQTIIERCGDNGELVIANPSKQSKDGQRSFKFNKVFGPASTQAEVYIETQPFVRSVLDGFNACIFAYGQTGSGKTHTMSGPKGATKEEWGVNFRALDDLFTISQNRKGSITYEIVVQMVEIYNEQVRDLLSTDGSQKKIGIVTNPQANGLAVPDATLKNVSSTSDVIVLMDTGLKNRSVSATSMNERSSRSHSIITIHVRGTEVKTGDALRGSLHLIDLAGSERIDRSEVTGDRLKEAQHINKSLAALGDVIFALSQKSNHVPYRNSKLTQLLQTSLGGQAKTLMFVQVNPESVSYTETLSTLKFAERVSGVELGSAKSSKDAKGDVKELMDQVSSLKDTISQKDEEIEQLRALKDLKNVHLGASANGEKRGTRS